MFEYVRNQYDTLKVRIEDPRKFIQAIVGPRQVGKSTLVGQVLKDISIPYTLEKADNVSSNDFGWIGKIWQSVRKTMEMILL